MAHRQIGTRRAAIIEDERNPNKTSPKYDRILVRCETMLRKFNKTYYSKSLRLMLQIIDHTMCTIRKYGLSSFVMKMSTVVRSSSNDVQMFAHVVCVMYSNSAMEISIIS